MSAVELSRARVGDAPSAMCAAMALWTIVEALGASVPSDYSPLQVVWTRYAVHLLLLLALVGSRLGVAVLRTSRPAIQLVRSLTMVGMPAFFLLALGDAGGGRDVWATFWIAPLLAMGLAGMMLREKASRPSWLAALLGFAGALLILRPSGHVGAAGALFAIAMATCFALYLVLTRLLRGESTESKLFYTAFGVLVALAPLMPAVWVRPTHRALLLMAGVGAVGLGALWALDRSLERSPVVLVAPLALTQPVWHLLAAGLRGRWPSPLAAGGALAVVVAAWVVYRGLGKHENETRGRPARPTSLSPPTQPARVPVDPQRAP